MSVPDNILEVRRIEGLVVGPQDRLIIKIDSRYVRPEVAAAIASEVPRLLGIKKALVVYAPMEATEFEVVRDESSAAASLSEERGREDKSGSPAGEGADGASPDRTHPPSPEPDRGDEAVPAGEVPQGLRGKD